jgi:hypothetical protein
MTEQTVLPNAAGGWAGGAYTGDRPGQQSGLAELGEPGPGVIPLPGRELGVAEICQRAGLLETAANGPVTRQGLP